MTKITNIDTIKSLWSELPNDGTKTKVIEEMATIFNVSPNTISKHWVTRFWSVPKDNELGVIKCLRKWVKKTSKTITV